MASRIRITVVRAAVAEVEVDGFWECEVMVGSVIIHSRRHWSPNTSHKLCKTMHDAMILGT